MFTDAKAPVAPQSPMIEGCPVIEVCDETQDIYNLMSALYGPINFKMDSVEGFLHLSSILRLATKYCIDWLRVKAANYLSIFWPNTLQGWINLPRTIKTVPIPHPALIINLARQVDLPIFLPIAFYRLRRMSTKEAHEIELTSAAGPIPKAAYRLSLEDVLNHLRYKERESLSARSFVEGFLDEFKPDLTCEFSAHEVNRCSKNIKRISSFVCRSYVCHYKPLSLMDAAATKVYPICNPCRNRLDAAVEEKRQALWDELPSWFGLPDWQVLMAGFTKEEESYEM